MYLLIHTNTRHYTILPLYIGDKIVQELIQKRKYEKEFAQLLKDQPGINPIALEFSLKGKYKLGIYVFCIL